VARCVQDQILFGNVEQIEEFEIAVEYVDLFFAAVRAAEEERFFGKNDIGRRTDDDARGA